MIRKSIIASFLLTLSAIAYAGPVGPPAMNPIYNQSTAQSAAFNVGTGTVRGPFTVNVTNALLATNGSNVIISTTVDLGASNVGGTIAAGRFPALTGDVTTSAGSLVNTAAASQANIKTFTSSITVTGAGGISNTYGIATSTIQVSSNAVLSGTTFYRNGPVSISTNVVIANNGGLTAQWDASAPTGSTLLLGTSHNFTSGDETAGTSVNSCYDFISGSYNWGIHAHMPAGTGDHRRGFVAGAHGASDTAYSAVVDDTNNTSTPIHIWQSGPTGNSAQSLIQIDAATDWRTGTPLGVFTGHYMTIYSSGTSGTPVWQLDYDGALRVKDVNGTVPITLESSGNFVASQLVVKNDVAAGYSMINYVGTAADSWLVGVANGAEPLFGIPNSFFLYDQTAGAMRLTIGSTGNVSIPGAGLSVTNSLTAGTGAFYTTTASSESLVVKSTNNVTAFAVSNSSVTPGDYMLAVSSIPTSVAVPLTQQLLNVDTYGTFAILGVPLATLKISTPTATNRFVNCSTCVTTAFCVSTGTTVAYQYGSATAKTSACQ